MHPGWERGARARWGIVLLLLLALGCGEDAGGAGSTRHPPADPPPPPVEDEIIGGFPARLHWRDRDHFPHLVDPQVVPAAQADWLHDEDEVIGVEVGGATRAYPANILAYYHSVDDSLGGAPILVAYCSVCASASTFDPRVGDRRLTFGFGGAVHGMSVLYDRQTRSSWHQLTGACFEGYFEGVSLARTGTTDVTTWGLWRRSHPETTVIRPPEDLMKSYLQMRGRLSGDPFLPSPLERTLAPLDLRLGPNVVVLGVRVGDALRAYATPDLIRAGGVVLDELGGEPLLVVRHPQDGTLAAFHGHPDVAMDRLSWSDEGLLVERGTGRAFDLSGRCRSGACKDFRLKRRVAVQSEWYGWSGLHPETTIWGHP